MSFKAGLLFIALLLGSHAFPVEKYEQDMSMFFDHTDSESRIVGGSASALIPFVVALTQGITVRSFFCGGSLITVRRVLTAAHCISGIALSNTYIVVGAARWATGGTSYAVNLRFIHPNYNANQLKSDIGMLGVTFNVVLNTQVQLVSLNYNWVGAGVGTRVFGWGRTQTDGSISQALLVLDKTTVNGQSCVDDVARRSRELGIAVPAVNSNLEICTFNSDGRGTCNGDSGGPLMRTDRYQQIGIASWGIPCARNAPDMHVRLSVFQSWIEDNL